MYRRHTISNPAGLRLYRMKAGFFFYKTMTSNKNGIEFTIFPNLKNNDGLFTSTLDDVYKVTKEGGRGEEIKNLITKIRTISDKKERNKYKEKLACICFSGSFTQRSREGITSHSGLIGLDFDGMTPDELTKFKEQVRQDKYTRMSFISPSGNGLKVIIQIPADIEKHGQYFRGLAEYYVRNYIQHADEAAKDVPRVCFASYDPDTYYNPQSEIFTTAVDLSKRSMPQASKAPTNGERANDADAMDIIIGWIEKDVQFVQGSRHYHLTNFVIRANKAGIDKDTIIAYYESNYDHDNVKKITYNICDSSRASLLFNTKPVYSKSPKTYSKEAINTPRNEASIVDIETFWFTTEDKNGNVKLNFSRHKFLDWLHNEGWARFHSTPNDWELVMVKNNIVEKRSKPELKKSVMSYVAGLPFSFDGIFRAQLVEMLVKGASAYFGNDSLEFLPALDVSTHMDTFDNGWMFYRNTAVKITAQEIEPIPYSEIGAYIWKSQILDRDFIIEGDLQNDFCKFLMIVAGSERFDDLTDKRFLTRLKAFETSVGYLMHGYKNSAMCPAIILNDAYNDGDEPRGGTGKGVFLRAIRYMRDTAMFDGKTWKQDKSFAFQIIQASTQIAAFEDIKANFDFEGFFSIITEGFNIEKKGKDAYKIPFENSPKVVFTTNYPIKGEGSSHERRRVELELDDFFINNPPYEYFGHRLFDDWSVAEWQSFDRYMTYCLQRFLALSIVKLATDNLQDRKLRELTDPVFVEWFTNWVQVGKYANSHIKDLLGSYNSDFEKYSQRRITGWVKAFTKHYQMETVKDARTTINGRSVQATEITTMGTLVVVSSGKTLDVVVKTFDLVEDKDALPF